MHSHWGGPISICDMKIYLTSQNRRIKTSNVCCQIYVPAWSYSIGDGWERTPVKTANFCFYIPAVHSLSNRKAHSRSQKNNVECELFLFPEHQGKNHKSGSITNAISFFAVVKGSHDYSLLHTTLSWGTEIKYGKSCNLVVFFWLKFLWLHARQWPSSLLWLFFLYNLE